MIVDDILDLIGVEHGQQYAARGSCQLGNRGDRTAADGIKPPPAGQVDVLASHRNSGVQQSRGINLAHQTESDDGDRLCFNHFSRPTIEHSETGF